MKTSKGVIILVAIVLGMFFTSCTKPDKYLEKAKSLQNSDMKLEANNEYIRALKYIKDPKEILKIQIQIARNYFDADQHEESINWYKKAIETANQANLVPPYRRLADCYISKGLPNEAAALIKEIQRVQPENYINSMAEISRLIAVYYEKKLELSESEYFYQQYLGYAEKLKNQRMISDAKLRLEMVQAKTK